MYSGNLVSAIQGTWTLETTLCWCKHCTHAIPMMRLALTGSERGRADHEFWDNLVPKFSHRTFQIGRNPRDMPIMTPPAFAWPLGRECVRERIGSRFSYRLIYNATVSRRRPLCYALWVCYRAGRRRHWSLPSPTGRVSIVTEIVNLLRHSFRSEDLTHRHWCNSRSLGTARSRPGINEDWLAVS